MPLIELIDDEDEVMKVLLANKFFHRNGGSETVLFQERDFLLENGVEVVDFSMKDDRNLESPFAAHFVEPVDYEGGGSRLKTAVRFIHSKEAVDKVTTLVRDTRPDIAHLHNIYHQLTPSIIPALKREGVKVVLTLHDTKLVCPRYLSLCRERICDRCQGRDFYHAALANCLDSRLKSLLLTLEAYFHKFRRSYEGVDKFIAPSRFLASKIMNGRPDLGNVDVLANGIDTSTITQSHQDHGYILYFGRLSKEKGVPTLIAAHQSMKNRPPLKIVGTGPLLEPLKAKHPEIEFTGYKTGYELKELISKSSCVVVPSEWYENCSMVVLESMAYGKPVVGSRVGGIPEQVEDDLTGCLFTMGDSEGLALKLDMLMGDSELRKNLGCAARQRLEEKFSLKAHNKGLMNIYDEVIQSK